MSKDLVISVDCSTTASKAVIWDRHGSSLAEGRCALPLLTPRPTWYEQPAESWWTATAQALSDAVAQVNPDRLAALCITHQRETFVPIDEKGQPMRGAIVWMDERSRTVLPDLDRLYGSDRIHQLTGKVVSSNLSLGKILWLRWNEPALFDRAYKYLDVHAYLVYRMTGRWRTGWGCADPMGMFDMGRHCWAQDLIQAIGLRMEQLPEVFAPGEILGEMTPEAAVACGVPAGLSIVAGLGDGQSAGLGTNIMRPGSAYLSLGTSVITGVYSEAYVAGRAFRTMNSGLPGTFLLETALLGGAYTINWFIEHFADVANLAPGTSAEATFEAAIQQIPPGSLGLMLVPYWNSVLSPYWDAAASGIVVGWRGAHGRAHLYRSILEGIAFEQRLNTSGVESALGQAVESFIAMGGGAKSSTWLQIMADITGKPIYRSSTPEAAALGAGILAASAAGLYADAREAAQAMAHIESAPVEPDPARSAFYSRLYEQVYQHLFPALQPYLNRLTELMESGGLYSGS
jgi:sugar (pentulose or hexulose) kinase